MKNYLLLFSFFLITACSIDHGNYSVMSNKIVRINEFDLDKSNRVKHVKGIDRSHIIFFHKTKNTPNLSDALSDALKKGDGDVMTDVTVTEWTWYIPLIYGQSGWTVEGDVVKTRNK